MCREVKTDGLSMIRRVVYFHPETFSPAVLHPVILAVVNEVMSSQFGIIVTQASAQLDALGRHFLSINSANMQA